MSLGTVRSNLDSTDCVFLKAVEKIVSGIIIHASSKEGEKDPIYSHKVDLYVKSFLGNETYLATTTTNNKGKFSFKYTQYSVGSFDRMETMVVKIHRTSQSRGVISFFHPIINEVTFEKPFDETDFKVKAPLRASILEYNIKKGNPFPEFIEDTLQIEVPNDLEFLKTIVGTSWKSILLSLAIKPFENYMTVDHVCKMFNKTERKTFTSELLIKMVTDGIYVPQIEKDEKTECLIIKTNWNPKSIDYSPEKPDVPNVCIFLKETENGLKIIQIDIQLFKKDGKQFEEKKPEEIYDKKISYFPDNKNFDRAIQLASCGVLTAAQLLSHLALHYNVGKPTRMLWRRVINNPIAKAVKAPIEGTEATNAAAKPLLTKEETGALTKTGFTQAGLIFELSQGVLAAKHPFSDRFKGDTFAQRARCVRDTLRKGYAKFVKHHYDAIVKEWHEIFYLSEDNIEHGVNPVRITKNKDKPEPGDMERLIDFLADYAYYSSYGHWVIHNSQKDWSQDPDINMGPNVYFSKDRLGDGDPFMGVNADFAYQQLSIGIALTSIGDNLSKTKSLKNHPDQIPEVKKAIEQDEEKWKKLGLDPEIILASIYS